MAGIGMSESARRDQPTASGMFLCTPGRIGLAEHRFDKPLHA